jgi:hypothetical protein
LFWENNHKDIFEAVPLPWVKKRWRCEVGRCREPCKKTIQHVPVLELWKEAAFKNSCIHGGISEKVVIVAVGDIRIPPNQTFPKMVRSEKTIENKRKYKFNLSLLAKTINNGYQMKLSYKKSKCFLNCDFAHFSKHNFQYSNFNWILWESKWIKSRRFEKVWKILKESNTGSFIKKWGILFVHLLKPHWNDIQLKMNEIIN